MHEHKQQALRSTAYRVAVGLLLGLGALPVTAAVASPTEAERIARPHGFTICHIPPGNPDNARTIVVNDGSLPVHFEHGDYAGSCGAHNQITGRDELARAGEP